MEGQPLVISIGFWAALFFCAQGSDSRSLTNHYINQPISMLQDPAAAAHSSARMHPALLVKQGRELKAWKRQTVEHRAITERM